MKQNKLFLLISFFSLICLFGTAAICSQFGEEGDEAPTLELKISEGPIFSEEDQICYYEIEAIATGNPEPDIEFIMDENVSLLTSEKVKVILNDSDDLYTIEATATNTAGSAKVFINLSWGCEEEVTHEEQTIEAEVSDEEEQDGEEIEEGQDESQEDNEEEHFAPELSIYIEEGPEYSAADDICYYRIASELYGYPFPDLSWSKDDSNGAFGPTMVQVNLRRGETYTLTATAVNSEGIATAELSLSWGCDGDAGNGADEIVDGDENSGSQNIETVLTVVNGSSGETGSLFSNGHFSDGNLTVGDDDVNNSSQGFVSFDISNISGATIYDVELQMITSRVEGDLGIFNKFYIGSYDWGEGRPGLEDLYKAVTMVIKAHEIDANLINAITVSNLALKKELQEAVNEGKSRFRIKVYFSGKQTDNDNIPDRIIFSRNNIVFNIEYIQ